MKAAVFACPECEKAGTITTYATARHLGIHRKTAHGVLGSSKSAMERQQRIAKLAAEAARKKGERAAAKAAKLATSNGAHVPAKRKAPKARLAAPQVPGRPLLHSHVDYHHHVGHITARIENIIHAEATVHGYQPTALQEDVTAYLAGRIAPR